MNTLISKIAFVALMQGFVCPLFAHVELDNPVGGETFTGGQTVTIEWHIAITHNTLNWDLLFSSDGGATWEPIQMDLPPGTLSYQWIVPSIITSQARVSVIQDNSAQDYQDESLDFTIAAPPTPPSIVTGASDLSIESNVANQESAIQTWLDNHGGATATSSCSDLVWTNDYTGLNINCGVSGIALVMFTATDACGSTETSATLTVIDSAPPILETPAGNLVVECGGNGNPTDLTTWLENQGGAQASDAGGNVIWSNDYSNLSNGCGSTGGASVLFTGTDDCGNWITTSATFTIGDHIAPAFEVAAVDTIIACGLSNTQAVLQDWLARHGGAKANDLCGSVAWTNNFPVVVDTCHASTIVSVVFTAIDECGNSNSTSATVNLMGTLGTTDSDFPDFSFTLSPNPVSQMLRVDLDMYESRPVHLTLFDACGKPVLSLKEISGDMNIPVHGYIPGVYYLQAEMNQGVYTRKVIID